MSSLAECWDAGLDFRAGQCTWVYGHMWHNLRRLRSTTGVTAVSSIRDSCGAYLTNKQVKLQLCNSCMLKVRGPPTQ